MKYLSFVVPSYNASKYLDKVIPSLLVGGDDVEIIVVNDGSKDNTLEIAKRYEALYPNIVKAVDKENGGHGSTINKALEIATGLYFKCVDADDWLEENALKTLLAKIKYHHEKNTLPDLKVISGTYSNEGESGDVYVQDFEIAEDGIAEFPRITSGMIPEDFDTFTAVNGVGLYGVFSHFIHPDDIFDEERGKNQTWEKLYEGYCDMMDWLHATFTFLRPLTAAEAADALKVADQVEPHLEIAEEEIVGSLENFYGEAFFYLKTDKKPVAADDSCSIEQIDPEKGSLYYIVTVKRPNFKIKLVDK